MFRTLSLALCLAFALAAPAFAGEKANDATMELWKSPTCNCCGKWVDHMRAKGFALNVHDSQPSALQTIKRQAGITRDLASCHTGRIGGYVIEGHVPAADVKRLLKERPEAIGLTVPGMPIGTPGMEGPGAEPYEVLLIKPDGSTEVFARHG